MGSLIYGAAPVIRMDDRVLRHVQVVAISKLRRNEPFAFNWDQEPGVVGDEVWGSSHGTIWISNASQLYFQYDGPRSEQKLNSTWLEMLSKATYRLEGLSALPEPVK
ncbi:MAG TPA: hypothetical protein VIL55_16235 [Naasia sp.]|jgi:hypothetical protein